MSNYESKIEFDNALNEAGWALVRELNKYGGVTGHMFNNLKPSLKVAIECYISEKEKEQPIPQTNIETPEENDVEWVNGDECISSAGYKLTFIGMCNHSRFDCILLSEMGVPTFGFVKELSKPETPRQLEERERKEARAGIERLLEDRINFHNSMLPKTISKIIYDAGYRKEG